jgi:hypothetical protein
MHKLFPPSLPGDGSGMMHCYSALTARDQASAPSNEASPGCLKYGLGCSREGAVRTIGRVGKKIVTGSEDGKALIFTY